MEMDKCCKCDKCGNSTEIEVSIEFDKKRLFFVHVNIECFNCESRVGTVVGFSGVVQEFSKTQGNFKAYLSRKGLWQKMDYPCFYQTLTIKIVDVDVDFKFNLKEKQMKMDKCCKCDKCGNSTEIEVSMEFNKQGLFFVHVNIECVNCESRVGTSVKFPSVVQEFSKTQGNFIAYLSQTGLWQKMD